MNLRIRHSPVMYDVERVLVLHQTEKKCRRHGGGVSSVVLKAKAEGTVFQEKSAEGTVFQALCSRPKQQMQGSNACPKTLC